MNKKHVLTSAFALAAALSLSAAAFADDAKGDPKAGGTVFNQCKACHRIGPGAKNLVGPELNGLIGRHSGSAPGYSYSAANKNSGITWDEKTFREYIKNPRAKIPGTKMAFAGIKDDKKITDLIAYLEQFGPDGNPPKK